ncbi:MAG TPA: ABC transporter substrate binding protein [Desulfobaccales bacterium]|jgi:ABC-type uncharacterized transport system substrate-binding protein|nr:ABC transporter substrate binding protein [Desulfobaccales bacterium]
MALIVLLLIFPILRAAPLPGSDSPRAETDLAQKHWKILHIMSYHSPWKWTDGQLEGFNAALRGLNIEYKVFQLDTKRRTDAAWKQAVSREARELIATWKPDLVYTSDDYVQEYVAKHYINQQLPLVFSGVNAAPSAYGFAGSSNITGVLEEEHFVETIKLLKQIVPTVKRIAVIYDDDPTWPPVLARMEKSLPQLPGIEIVSWDLIRTFAQFKQRITELQKEADAIGFLGIFAFKDEQDKNVSYKTVCRWVMDHSTLPDFSFWEDRISYGTLCTVNVSEYEQGYAAGEIARGILLEGRSPASYPMKPTVKGVPMINLLRAKKLGIQIKTGILLSVTVRDGVNEDF